MQCIICIRTWASLNRQSLQSECLPVQPHFPWRLGWCLLWTLWSAGSWLDQLTRNHPPGTQHQQAWLYDILKEQEQEVDFWQIVNFSHGWVCFYKHIFFKNWLRVHIKKVGHSSEEMDTPHRKLNWIDSKIYELQFIEDQQTQQRYFISPIKRRVFCKSGVLWLCFEFKVNWSILEVFFLHDP